MQILKVENLFKGFDELEVVNGVSFQIQQEK